MSDLIARLETLADESRYTFGMMTYSQTFARAAAALRQKEEQIHRETQRGDQLWQQLEDMRCERQARNAIDPMTRLHNLCDQLAEHRAESPYDDESWRLADEDNKQLRAQAAELAGALRGVIAVADRRTDEFDRAREALAMYDAAPPAQQPKAE